MAKDRNNTFPLKSEIFKRYISFILYKELNRVQAGFSREHVECYDKNNPPNVPLDTAVFEIQPTGLDGVSIRVNIDDEGSITPLYFGESGDLDTIFINVENPSIIGCPSVYGEATSSLKIQNGVIIESQCITA